MIIGRRFSRHLKAIVDLPFGQDEGLSLNLTATNGLVKYGGISGISPCRLYHFIDHKR